MNRFSEYKTPLYACFLAVSLVFTGCLTDEGDDDGDNGTAADSLSTRDVNVGAQSNTELGSSLDADDMVAYKIAEAIERAEDIDLVFAFSTVEGVDAAAIYSPDAAKAGIEGSEGFPFIQGLDPARTTPIRNVSDDAWDEVGTQQELEEAWDAASGSAVADGRLVVTPGEVFIVETNEDKLVMIMVDSVEQAADGTAVLSGKARF